MAKKRSVTRTGLRFDDRQRREGPAGFLDAIVELDDVRIVGNLGRAFQQPAVKVEHVAWVGLAPWRAPEHQRHLPVRGRLFRQIVVNAERVAPFLVHEVLGYRGPGIRRDELQRRRVGGRRGHYHRVPHRSRFTQPLHHSCNGRQFLTDGHVDADDVIALLVDDGVDGDGRLAGATVADDQFALATANGDHRVDRLDAGLQRLVDRLPNDDARGNHLHRAAPRLLDGSLAIDRLPQRVYHPAKRGGSDRHIQQAAGATNFVAFTQLEVVAHDGGADIVLFEVQHQTVDRLTRLGRSKLDHLAGNRGHQSVDTGDAVFHFQDGADVFGVDGRQIGGRYFLEKDFFEFAGAKDRIGGHDTRWLGLKRHFPVQLVKFITIGKPEQDSPMAVLPYCL